MRFVAGILENANVLGLQALRSLDNVEFNGLAFLQRTETVRLDGGEVDENVLTALTADETKTLSVVEPLNCTLFHLCKTLFCIGITLELKPEDLQAGFVARLVERTALVQTQH
jgi:hypothetical protein